MAKAVNEETFFDNQICKIKVQKSDFNGNDYHVFYLGKFFMTCPSERTATQLVNRLTNNYEMRSA